MSEIPFSYATFEETREKLINGVNAIMTEDDRRFLISFEELTVDWENTPYVSFKEYPSVKWKIQNLQRLKASNPQKLREEANKLRKVFDLG